MELGSACHRGGAGDGGVAGGAGHGETCSESMVEAAVELGRPKSPVAICVAK